MLGVDVMAFVEPVVEADQHLAGAGGVLGLALDLHLGAARGDIDAEPVLDRDQIAVELAEQRPEQVRLLELDLEPGAGTGGLGGAFFCAITRPSASVRRRPGCSGRPTAISTSTRSPIAASVSRWTDCSQGDLPTSWPGLRARAFEQHLAAPADARLVEGQLLRVEQRLEALQPFVHHLARDLSVHLRGGRAGAGGIFERESLRVVHRVDDPQRLLEIGVGLAGEADDEIARDGDVGPGGADAVDDRADSSPRVWLRFIALSTRSLPDCTGRWRIGHQLVDFGMGADQAFGHVVGMAGRVADARQSGQRVERADQPVEARSRRSRPRPSRR